MSESVLGAVKVYDGDGNLARVIPAAELGARPHQTKVAPRIPPAKPKQATARKVRAHDEGRRSWASNSF